MSPFLFNTNNTTAERMNITELVLWLLEFFDLFGDRIEKILSRRNKVRSVLIYGRYFMLPVDLPKSAREKNRFMPS